MKICPDCALANQERFPACVVCHASLADIASTPAADPAHPEHARRDLDRRRRQTARHQLIWATICYLLVVSGSAVWPGSILDPQVLTLYAASSLVVALAALYDLAGVFVAALLQGTASLALVLCFGPAQPFVFFMLAIHILAPMVFCHWTEMIHDAHR